eukprot:TRINITY_DN20976_c0_g1_i1.p1 TRINITY_DN20976_c0_g1~~TRINITY_DN20976_c0_g1_i1.p1  ORF type:complete len:278 (-),score=-13.48 TRINITY_DN20976_c0_g1_i1:214-1047(-)
MSTLKANPLQGPASGFWGEVTSNVDFCEFNYVRTPYLAEVYSSLSSLAAIPPVFLLYTSLPAVPTYRFRFLYLCMVAVSLGSFFFHSTLTASGQLLDELPMLGLIMGLLFCLIENERERKFRGLEVMMLIAVAGFVTVYVWGGHYLIFNAGFTLLVISYVTWSSIVVGKNAIVGHAWFLTAYILWGLDNAFCPDIEAIQLHSWWHILSMVAVARSINALLWYRLKYILGVPCEIETRYLIWPSLVLQAELKEVTEKGEKHAVTKDDRLKEQEGLLQT